MTYTEEIHKVTRKNNTVGISESGAAQVIDLPLSGDRRGTSAGASGRNSLMADTCVLTNVAVLHS